MAIVVNGKKVSSLTAKTSLSDTDLFYVSSSGADRKLTFGNLSLAISGDILPSGGTNGQVLTTNGAGVYSWTTVSGGGNVTKVGTPVNNQIGVWTGNGTIEGDSSLTWDGSNFSISSSGPDPSTTISVGGVSARSASNGTASVSMGSSPASGQTDIPTIRGNSTIAATNAREALLVRGDLGSGNDTGSVPVLILSSSRTGGSALTTRPSLAGYNYTTKQWEVSATGDWDYQNNDITNIGNIKLNASFPTTNQPVGTLWLNGGVLTMGTL